MASGLVSGRWYSFPGVSSEWQLIPFLLLFMLIKQLAWQVISSSGAIIPGECSE